MRSVFFLGIMLAYVTTTQAYLPVVVSTGAYITPLKGIHVYNEMELLHHIISDLPDPPVSVVSVCPEGATEKSCNLIKHVHKILEDNSAVLTLLNKARTTYGLKDGTLASVILSKNSFRPVKEPKVSNDPPSEDIVKVAGKSWYDDVKDRLLDRTLYYNESSVDVHLLRKRFVQYIKPLVVATAAVLGADDLFDLVSNLFVGDNGILRYLTTLQATAPELSLVDLSRRVSEFEMATRALTADIVEEAEEVKKITEDLQLDVAQHKMDLAAVEDGHIATQQMLSDLGSLLFTYGIYFSIMDADTNCRSGYLSPLLLPPNLLGEKIAEVAALLPSDLKLVIGLDKIQSYYTSKSATCMYDSNGGIITVSIPVSYKAADYRIYEYRNIFFAWDKLTCMLNAASAFLIKDLKSNLVFPVENVDEETCSPHLTRRCKVPPASDSAESYCLNQLLSSSTVSEVREACKMTCFDKNETIVSTIHPNVFLAVHVPKDSMTIECPNHEMFNVSEEVPYGALRVILNCGACTIKIHGKSVGRSVGPACLGHESVTVEILLPGHWTTLTDFLLFTSDGSTDGTTFRHITEIFNPHAMDERELEELNVINNAVGVGVINALPMAETHDNHYCKIEEDLYYILYLICRLCSLAFVPPVLCKIYSFIGRQFWDAVDIQTNKRIADGIV